MNKHLARLLFNSLYRTVDGYAISRESQKKLGYYYNANVYGEIDFDSFHHILSIVKPKQNNIFYDLGSGTGKAAILAALCFPFSKSIGIERIADLYKSSVEVAKKLNNKQIEFHQTDFNRYDFSDGNILYLNSYYFYYEMYNSSFKNKIKKLMKYSKIITIHQPYISQELKIIYSDSHKFSWGDAIVYISEKIHD